MRFKDEHPLCLRFVPLFIFLFSIGIVNAQNYTNYTYDPCQGINVETCSRCVPKSWTRFLNPSELLTTIINWILKSVNVTLPSITISLIGLLLIVVTIWLAASKIDKILLIIVILLIMMIVITAILHMINPTIIPI